VLGFADADLVIRESRLNFFARAVAEGERVGASLGGGSLAMAYGR